MDAEPVWVRVGGGMESVPGHQRHGPADVDFPPPGGPWEPLVLNGKLVGWAAQSGLRMARKSAEMGQRLIDEQRDHLLGRLGHKLRSSVLALQESARQAAFGRPELLEAVFEQAQEVGRRAAGLEAAAIDPKDSARGVVLGAVLNLAVPSAAHNVPPAAAVIGSEPALVEALTRIKEWLVADSLTVSAEPFGSWWKVRISVSGERRQPAVPELGEPLVRLIVDTHLDGWLDVSPPDGVDIYLPAYHPR
ncbi:MAG: hypothetical protein E6I61_03530 [Chloroflexi bacterium]|nr:MAG: hypothetical protein E6J08_12055 [Chloroflexota bacterium]TME04951.1 MAG: hypothetical protein E6I71_04775 [Chloroflexota bacterium]TME42157.1 MAG: hypothetical protein E6I61_03530 [Chloroflexota bacterium]TME52394.1 MAG: hypothetical protein E6I53_06770 [Chloroflexota bacterium]